MSSAREAAAKFSEVVGTLIGEQVTLTEVCRIRSDSDLFRGNIHDNRVRKLILDSSKHLRDTQHSHVFIRRDLTFQQREELKARYPPRSHHQDQGSPRGTVAPVRQREANQPQRVSALPRSESPSPYQETVPKRVVVATGNNSAAHPSDSQVQVVATGNNSAAHPSDSQVQVVTTGNNSAAHPSDSQVQVVATGNNSAAHPSDSQVQVVATGNNSAAHPSDSQVQVVTTGNNSAAHPSDSQVQVVATGNNSVAHPSDSQVQVVATDNNSAAHPSDSQVQVTTGNNSAAHPSDSQVQVRVTDNNSAAQQQNPNPVDAASDAQVQRDHLLPNSSEGN